VNSPGVRFPPPFIFVLGFLAGLGLERWVYRMSFGSRRPLALAGWTLAVAALALGGWAMITFWRARTAIIPHRPASRLVRHGPYRFTRNPMYVALTALYVGLALLFNVAWPLVVLPAVLWLLWHLVIRHEERYLHFAFGGDYAAFTREVRRWL
jgi:protein-S-isoprenylcysteine O-methyltransferase Ste14